MTLIEKYRESIVVLDNYVHNGWHGDTESDAIGFFFELEEKEDDYKPNITRKKRGWNVD